MSDLTITTAGVAQTAEAGSDGLKGAVIRVTPAIHAAASTDNDVMCLTTEIPKAVNQRGGVSKLVGLSYTCKQVLDLNIDLIIMQVNKNYTDAAGNAINISDDDLVASKVLGIFEWGGSPVELNGNEVHTFTKDASGNDPGELPVLLQAKPDSTSVYFTIIDRDGGDTFTATDLTFAFHIEYLD